MKGRTVHKYITLNLNIPKLQKQGILKTIDAIRDLFGNKGEYWIKDDYKQTGLQTGLQKGFDSFCLAGAALKVNGKYEDAARAAISLAIMENQKRLLDIAEVANEENITSFNDRNKTKFSDVLKVIKRAKQLVKEC